MDRIDTNRSKAVLASLRTGATPVARAGSARKADAEVKAAVGTKGGSAVSAGSEPPVDADRVAEIRKAIEDGRYPVVPTRIADAMIAAGFLLRNER